MFCKKFIQHILHPFLLISLFYILNEAVKFKKNSSEYCDICKHIAEKFQEGVQKTSRSNFGGGNTNWEEKYLGNYGRSETRLVEILESCCEGLEDKTSTSRCHGLIEDNDDWIEDWWRQEYHQDPKKDLFYDFCVKKTETCCVKGTYGPNCTECPGGWVNPCRGNGECLGSGYRDGEGKCQCHSGYEGDDCDHCLPGFVTQTDGRCLGCHKSCKSTCSSPSDPKSCHECKEGWTMVEGQGCVDVDECADENRCPSHTFCRNEEGSSACLDCDKSCNGCTGPLKEQCKACANDHYMDGITCKKCHEACRDSCSDGTASSCHSCASGWQHDGEACVDIDECAPGSPTHNCDPVASYCKNKKGSFSCKSCDPLCVGCTGSKANQCVECKEGYRMDDEHECVDVNECEQETPVCQEEHEICENIVGSFICGCEDGFVRRKKGPCQKKHIIISDETRPKKSTKDEPAKDEPAKNEPQRDKPQEREPKVREPRPSFDEFQSVKPGPGGFTEDDLKKLGDPLEGTPLDEKIVMEGKAKLGGGDGGDRKTEL